MAQAPVFRGISAPVFTANSVVNPTNLNPATPGGTAVGDCLVLLTASRSITATVGTPTGWTLISGFPKTSGTASGGRIYAFVRIADGGANDAPTVTWTGLTTGTSGDSASATMISYYGVQAVSDGVGTPTDAAATTTWTIPAVTTATNNSLEVTCSIRVSDTAQTATVAFPHRERGDTHTTTGTGHLLYITDRVTGSAGAQASVTATPSNTTSARTLSVSFGLLPKADNTDNTFGPAFDTSGAATAGTGPLSWTHTPTGGVTPDGVVVFVVENSAAATITQEVTGVTYGGQAMTLVGSQLQDVFTEDGLILCYFLGDPALIGAGAKTVSVAQSGATNNKMGISVGLTNGGGKTQVANFAGSKAAVAEQSWGQVLNAGTKGAWVAGVLHTTDTNPATSTLPISNVSSLNMTDFGAQGANFVRVVTEGETGNVSVGWIHTAALEGAAAFAVAVEAAPALIALQTSALASTTAAALSAKTAIPLQTAADIVSTTSLALFAPTTIPLQSAALAFGDSAALSALTQIPLQSAALAFTDSATLTIPALIALQSANLTSTTSAVLRALTQIPLQAAGLSATTAAALSAQTRVPLQSSDLLTTTAAALRALTQIPLQSAGLTSTTAAALKSLTQVPLQSAGLTSTTAAALQALTQVPLQSAALQTTTSAGLSAKTAITLQAAALQSAATAALQARTEIPLQTAALQTTTSAGLTVTALLTLNPSALTSGTGNLPLHTPHVKVLPHTVPAHLVIEDRRGHLRVENYHSMASLAAALGALGVGAAETRQIVEAYQSAAQIDDRTGTLVVDG